MLSRPTVRTPEHEARLDAGRALKKRLRQRSAVWDSAVRGTYVKPGTQAKRRQEQAARDAAREED